MAAPTVTAPATPGSSSLLGWVSILVVLAYIAVLVWVATGRPPLRAALLRAVMTGSQTAARHVGTLGMRAEAAYRRTVSPDGTT